MYQKRTNKRKKMERKKNANDMSTGSIGIAELFSPLYAYTWTKQNKTKQKTEV